MVTDPCALDALANGAACFNCLSKTEKQAMRTWFLAKALAAAGGVDLTNADTLLKVVACFGCESDFMMDSIDVLVAEETATANGASFTGQGIADFRKDIKCLACADPKLVRVAEVYLRCKLNHYFQGQLIL